MQQSSDQQKKIIKYVIKATPFGETKEVVKDLVKIMPSLTATDEVILQALKEHNEDHLAVFRKDGDAKNYIVSSVLNSQENTYVDQKKGLTITVDHTNLTVVSSESVDLPANPKLDAFRDALELELKAYLNSYFKDQLSGFYVLYTGDESNFNFFIGVSAKNINLPNFYCGDWVSKWDLTSTELKGEASIQAHYYEEGNVQLKNSNKFSEGLNISLDKPEEGAKAVVETLARLENRHQDAMDKVYQNMPELFFKAMRRVLPVTGTKFDWNVHAHKVAASLKQQ